MSRIAICRGPSAALFFFFVAALAAPCARGDEAEEPIPLAPGVPIGGALPARADPEAAAEYFFDVGPDVLAVRIELDARADLDFDVIFDGKRVASSRDTTGRERVYLDRAFDPPLLEGRYTVRVFYPGGRRPAPPRRADGRAMAEVPYRIKLVAIRVRVDGTLSPGAPTRGELDPETGSFRTYTIDVPPGARALRIDLSDAPADLGLRVRRGAPIVDPEDADAEARSPLGTETLLLEPDGDPPLRPGRWYVDVIDEVGLSWKVPFVLRASFGPAPDRALLALPRPPAPRTPLERALLATVEIVGEDGGGSGVLVGERGHILTNYHVVREKIESAADLGPPLAVALTIDPRDPPREAFRARVVTANAELDLALLEVTSGLYGQPIPPDYRFPTVPLGDPERLSVGAPLYAVGFPDIGGEGSRVSVTVTRGIVAGFERRGAALHVKTDAPINAGNSGGAALDERFELVGFPTETITDEEMNGQIGFVRPLWLIPREWWRIAGAREPPQR